LKTILILAALALIYIIIRHLMRQSPKSDANKADSQKMVRCEHCGLFLPSREAVNEEGHFFCCEEHRHAGQSN